MFIWYTYDRRLGYYDWFRSNRSCLVNPSPSDCGLELVVWDDNGTLISRSDPSCRVELRRVRRVIRPPARTTLAGERTTSGPLRTQR
jgi:hypothetical protein